MESALARSAGCRTGDGAVALGARVATHSQGRHHCGAGRRNADRCHVGQGAGTNGQRSSSVADGHRVVADTDHRAGCSGVRAVKPRAARRNHDEERRLPPPAAVATSPVPPDQSGYSSVQVRVSSYQLAHKTSASSARRRSDVPDCGSREYIIMRIDCGRQRHRVRAFTFRSISRLAIACAFLGVLFGSAAAQAQAPRFGRRLDMQHRSEGRTGPRLAAGYAMCFRCERNGPTIRLQRHDQAHWRRYWRDARRNTVLGCFCAKQPNRPRHVKRKLRRGQRQRCRRPGSWRQGTDWRIPPHDHAAAVVGRRPSE